MKFAKKLAKIARFSNLCFFWGFGLGFFCDSRDVGARVSILERDLGFFSYFFDFVVLGFCIGLCCEKVLIVVFVFLCCDLFFRVTPICVFWGFALGFYFGL